MRSANLISAALIVLFALVASGLAFVGGKAVADPAGAYERGVAVGERQGREQARVSFAHGRAVGLGDGRRTGVAQGRALGRQESFGSFAGGWETDRWYLVRVRRGDRGARYGVQARVPVEHGQLYGLCSAEGTRVCQRLRVGATGRRSSSRRTASP